MNLLIALTPFYLLGNLHCLGMCGPLVMMIGKHRFRMLYFLGRILAFTLAGTLAGSAGAVINVLLNAYHLSAVFSLLFSIFFIAAGGFYLANRPFPAAQFFAKATAKSSHSLSLLLLRDTPNAAFLFGLSVVFLPCGQSLMVFSACALSGSWQVGMLNGFAFALLTSPSLLFAMEVHALLGRAKKYYRSLTGTTAILIGLISLCRGLAELEIIPHAGIKLPFDVHFMLY